jgi:hypothetical protein
MLLFSPCPLLSLFLCVLLFLTFCSIFLSLLWVLFCFLFLALLFFHVFLVCWVLLKGYLFMCARNKIHKKVKQDLLPLFQVNRRVSYSSPILLGHFYQLTTAFILVKTKCNVD